MNFSVFPCFSGKINNLSLRQSAFTFIEILIALSILAILFLPMMRLFSYSLYSTTHSQDMITATNLAQWQMERLKNIAITRANVKALGDSTYPAEGSPPLILNNTSWRIKNIITDGEPLEVQVEVYRVIHVRDDDEHADDSGLLEKDPVIRLVTLVEDTIWQEER